MALLVGARDTSGNASDGQEARFHRLTAACQEKILFVDILIAVFIFICFFVPNGMSSLSHPFLRFLLYLFCLPSSFQRPSPLCYGRENGVDEGEVDRPPSVAMSRRLLSGYK